MYPYHIRNAEDVEYTDSLITDLVRLYSEQRLFKFIAQNASRKYSNNDVSLLAKKFIESSLSKWREGSEYRYFIFKDDLLVGLIGFDRKESNKLEIWYLKSQNEPAIMLFILPELLEQYVRDNVIIATVTEDNTKSIDLLKKLNFIEKDTRNSEMLFEYTGMNKVQMIAFVSKGFADVSMSELSKIPGYKYLSHNEKRIRFEAYFIPNLLKFLLTIDDIILVCESGENIESVKDLVARFRNIDQRFSITTSSYKTTKEVVDSEFIKLKQQLEQTFHHVYEERIHDNLDFRLILDGNTTITGLRIFTESLYVRRYGHESDIGTLRSTIAAAMIMRLKRVCPKGLLFDPFCGTGTILCEGLLQDMQVTGGDIDKHKVEVAQRNVARLGSITPIQLHDAESESFLKIRPNMIVTNVPWGKQIKNRISIDKVVQNFKHILTKDGYIAVLSNEPIKWKACILKHFPAYDCEVRLLGYIGQSPSVVFAFPKQIE